MFDERIQQEQIGSYDEPYAEDLENAFQSYKQASPYHVASNLYYIKSMLPEFVQHGNNFGLIRAEAAAILYAVEQWAKELDASFVIDMWCDGDMRPFADAKSDDFNLVVMGVTEEPELNAAYLHMRNQESWQSVVTMDEHAKTIVGFSNEHAFLAMAARAQSAVLLASDFDYEVIAKWDQGARHVLNSTCMEEFESYAHLDQDALAKDLKNHVNSLDLSKDQGLENPGL